MTTKQKINAACDLLQSVSMLPDDSGPLYAEIDENDVVHVVREDGTPVVMMHRSAWEELRATPEPCDAHEKKQ